jgi:hypothetical protein
VNECNLGIGAILLNKDVGECEWKNFYIDYPLYEYDPYGKQWTGEVYNTCP